MKKSQLLINIEQRIDVEKKLISQHQVSADAARERLELLNQLVKENQNKNEKIKS